MNITLLHLSLSLLSTSPIYSQTSHSNLISSTFNHLQITNLFQDFYYSSIKNSLNPQLSILNSEFTKLLSRAITIDSEIISGITQTTRRILTFDHNIIYNSKFQNIKNPTNSGGALMSFSSIEITNCIFDECYGNEGGAISCFNYYDISHVTFSNCQATTQSGALDACYSLKKLATNHFLYNSISSCKAKYFGAFYKKGSKVTLSIEYSNITDVYASECVGCFENHGGFFFSKFFVISNSSAKVHNGGIVTRSVENFDIQYCLFYKCKHSSSENNAAAAILVYDNSYSSVISKSFFIYCYPSNSYTITISSGSSNFRLDDCRFTGEQSREIRPNNMVKLDRNTIFNCQEQLCNLPEELENDDLYDQAIKENENNLVCAWKKVMSDAMKSNAFGYHTSNNIRDQNKANMNQISNSDMETLFLNILNIVAIVLSLMVSFLLINCMQIFRKCFRACKNRK